MANPTYYDCVRELWTGTTTSTITLSGTPVPGPPGKWRTFTEASVANGATVHVRIENQTATEVQVAEYTYDSGAGTLTYVRLIESSTGAQVTFTAGTKHLGIVVPAEAVNLIYDKQYATTATAAGTTTLTVASKANQFFTGVTTQTVALPVTSTLVLGHQFRIVNNSTGNLTINSSGGNLVATVIGGETLDLTCILTSGTNAASWSGFYSAWSSVTGTGANVLATGPSFTAPVLGTPTSGVLTNCTGTASGLTAGTVTTNANLTGPITSTGNATAIASQTGTGTKFVMDTSPTLVTPNIGTPSAGVLTSCTGLPISTGVSGLAANVATFLATPSSANLATMLTDETGSGANVHATSPALVSPTVTLTDTATSGTVNDLAITTTVNPGGASSAVTSGLSSSITYTSASNCTGGINGTKIAVSHNAASTLALAKGMTFEATVDNASATTTAVYGIEGTSQVNAGTGTSIYGMLGRAYTNGGNCNLGIGGYFETSKLAGGTYSFGYAVYANAAGAGTNYAMYVAGGSLQFQGAGVVCGAATGGDKGLGTINVSGSIQKNGTSYTNPDYVFEKYYTGKIEKYAKNEGAEFYRGLMPLERLEAFVSANHRFPCIPNNATGIFERADLALELIESQQLYIFELNARLKKIEQRCERASVWAAIKRVLWSTLSPIFRTKSCS